MGAFETRLLTRPPYIRETRTADGAVLLDPVRGKAYPLDPVSALIWSQIAEGVTTSQIVSTVAAECGAPAATVERDVAEFIQSLLEAGLVCRKLNMPSPMKADRKWLASKIKALINRLVKRH